MAITPKIIYGSTTLTFFFPPINKTGANNREAQRKDSISLSGLKQSIHWRTDQFLVLEIPLIPDVDVPAWEAFLDYALQGGEFSYYKDATLAGFTVYTLEDTKTTLKRNVRGHYQTTLNFRRVIGADQTGS
jgi:hypothetical protein